MADRRSLLDGLKPSLPSTTANLEKEFVYGTTSTRSAETAGSLPTPSPVTNPLPVARAPISTRIRADFAQALKRASLERQLSGVEPNTLQDILEEAIEPWLKANGYVP